MQLREADTDDAEAIRAVAHASLHASYEEPLGEDTIHEALERWYDTDRLRGKMRGGSMHYVAAEEDGDVVGFAQGIHLSGEATIQWIHVHPDHRGEGMGGALLERTRNKFAADGAERIVGEVLAANEAGNEFYSEHGFTLDGQRTVEITDELYDENAYVDVASLDRQLEPVETEEGTLYVDFGDQHRGKDAPWYPVYRSEDGSRRFGWYCEHCGSVDNAMDTLERVACNGCGNVRKAERWDAAYL